MNIPIIALPQYNTRQRRRVAAISFVVLVLALFAVVEGFVSRHPNSNQRRSPAHLCATATETNDVDVVGEGRRGDAKGAALRLVDVAVSRGGSTLLSNIDWRVEPKSKWGLVVSIIPRLSVYLYVIVCDRS